MGNGLTWPKTALLRAINDRAMKEYRQSLDSYDEIPDGMRRYLSHYGWHFNKKLYEYAAEQMWSEKNGKKDPVKAYTKEEIDELMMQNGIELDNDILHDAAYVATMCKADFLGRSITDEAHLAQYVKDYIDDPDAPDGTPMARWYATMVRAGIPVDWYEVL